MLTCHLDGMFAYSGYSNHTGVLESINKATKVIKRTAYGHRDEEYLCLKIRGIFPDTNTDP